MKEQQSKEKSKKKKKGLFLKIVIILLLIIAIAGGIFAYKVHQNGGGIKGIIKASLGHDEGTVNKLDKIYCLILGQSQNLTDTIMLASYDPKTQEAALLSIPRDTYIGENKEYATAWEKINAVYQNSVDDLLEDVNELTGIDVQYYLKVDTEALKVLVDEIGGVYFDVPIDMYYNDNKQGLHIDLEAGEQLLDGDKAEQVVRFRHNSDGSTYPSEYGGEDLGRMKTQRAFLTALLEQTIEKMNVNMVFDFLDIAEKYVETNLNFDVIKDYVPYILEFNIDALKTDTLPGIAEECNGVWIYSVDEEAAKETINKLFYGASPEEEMSGNIIEGNTIVTDTNLKINQSSIKVEVLNGSGDSSKLTDATSKLESSGFTVIQTGNTSATNNTVIIDRINLSEMNSSKIKEILGVQNIVTGTSDTTSDITVIIGTDYNL